MKADSNDEPLSTESSPSEKSSSPSSLSYPLIDNIIRKALLEEDNQEITIKNNFSEKEVEIRSGDLILFNRPCLSMQPMASFICYAAKITAVSQFDHVGIVVECTDHMNEKFQYGNLYLLEANMGGVTLHPLLDRLKRSKCKAFAIRKLKERDNDIININTKAELWKIALSSIGIQYDSSIISMSLALLASYYSHGQNSMMNRSKEIDEIIDILQNHNYSHPSLKSLVNLRIDQLQNEKLLIPYQPSSTNSSNKTMMRTKYFCSSLVADILNQSGIKQWDDRSSNLFIPSDFSSQSYINGFHTNPLFNYEKNVILFKNDKAMIFKNDNGVLKIYTSNAQKDALKFREQNSEKEKLVVQQVLMGVLTACPNSYHPPVVTKATKISKETLTCALKKANVLNVDEIINEKIINPDEIINEKHISKLSYGIILLRSVSLFTKKLRKII
jgi:hypothetical protein